MSCLCMVSQSQMSLTVNALMPTQCFSILIGCLQPAAAVSIDTVNILAHYVDNRSGSAAAAHATELIHSWLHHPIRACGSDCRCGIIPSCRNV